HGLAGKIANELDLLIGERPHLDAINDQRTDQLVLFTHWHSNERTSTGIPAGRTGVRSCQLVCDIDQLPSSQQQTERSIGLRSKRIALSKGYLIFRRYPAPSHCVEAGAVETKQNTKLCLANTHCVFQHRFEHRL